MEKFFGEVLGHLWGSAGYSVIVVILLIIGYFKYLKPFLADFEYIKTFVSTVSITHTEFHKKLDKLSDEVKDLNRDSNLFLDKKFSEADIHNSKEHLAISNEFGKIKYLMEEMARKGEKISDKDSAIFNDIILELSKIQSKLDYMNTGGLGGLKK